MSLLSNLHIKNVWQFSKGKKNMALLAVPGLFQAFIFFKPAGFSAFYVRVLENHLFWINFK